MAETALFSRRLRASAVNWFYMDRNYYLELAARGLRVPIGTDLALHEQPGAEEIMRDACRLGKVMECAARRYGAPLAFPLIDLRLEKADLLGILGVAESEVETFHFSEAPAPELLQTMARAEAAPFSPRGEAHIGSVRYIAEETDLLPVGTAIGPFSLMTKLMADPIAPIAMAGMGMTAEEDGGVLMAERCLRLAEMAVARSPCSCASRRPTWSIFRPSRLPPERTSSSGSSCSPTCG